jgi:hypothetical protein
MRGRVTIVAVVILIAVSVRAQPRAGDDTFAVFGVGILSCGKFLLAADAERKRRPLNAKMNSLYDVDYIGFASYEEGFLVGTNYGDPIVKGAGEGSDPAGRMYWLENYCHNHPLESYIAALINLRKHLASK